MKLSKKGRYGLRALVDLSVYSKTEHVSLSSIAERNNISLQYLEQVFASLRKAGIIKSIKGPQGGYLLNRKAEDITVAEVLEVLEGGYRIEDEDVPADSDGYGIAAAIQQELIDQVNRQLEEILTHVTVAELEHSYQEFTQHSRNMYYI